MTETKSKRRGWVKNAAIIFLAVLLVLTFFSQTILNRSLPEVAAQYPTSGSINLRIRGTGAVSANQTQTVAISESRKVKGVAIRVGDEVTQGQALFLLADTESTELATAQETLDSMELAYEKALLDATLADSSSNYDILKAQLSLQEAIERRDKAKVYDSEREPLEQAVEDAANALADAMNNADALPEKAVLDAANEALEKATAAQEKANTDFTYYANLYGVTEYGGLADGLDQLFNELDDLYVSQEKLERQIDDAQDRLDDAEDVLIDVERALNRTIEEAADSYLDSPNPAQQLEEIRAQYDEAKSVWDDLVSLYYSWCVGIENDNTDDTFSSSGVRLRNVLVFVTSEYGEDTELLELINLIKDESASSSSRDEALTHVYRSMVWWHLTYDAASAYDAAAGAEDGVGPIEDELYDLHQQWEQLMKQITDKEDAIADQKALLSNPDLSNAFSAVQAANEAVKLANDEVYNAQQAYNTAAKSPAANVEKAQEAYDKAKERLDALELAYQGIGTYTEEQQNVLSAQQSLESLYTAQSSENINQQKEALDLEDQKRKLDDQRALVEQLQADASETIIYSPCNGTVLSVNVSAGDTTIMDEAMAEIELTDQGHTLTFEVSKEQAAMVNLGDQATIENRWGVDIIATLVSISNSKTSPGTMKVLTFDLKGEDVVAGQSLTLSVGQKSQNYEVIIPNSALREDANGKFVLVVRSKNTPLGNRYSVSRVDVEVLASDDNNSAVKGMLTTGDFVVITSTAPLSAGDQVRLSEQS